MASAMPGEVEHVTLVFGSVLVRPLRPNDRAAYRHFLWRLDPEDIRLRMGRLMRADRRLYDRLLDFDRGREEAFVALGCDGAILGIGRVVLDAGGEIALIVRSDMKHRGIGEALLDVRLRHVREPADAQPRAQAWRALRRRSALQPRRAALSDRLRLRPGRGPSSRPAPRGRTSRRRIAPG